MKPRYYQTDAVNAIWDYLIEQTGNPLVALPTGTGKAYILSLFIELLLRQHPNARFLVLTHVKELIKQDYDTLKRIWPTAPAGIYSAGLDRKDVRFPIVFGGVASVVGNVKEFGHRDIVIVDECHLISPKDGTMYSKIVTELTVINPSLRVVGLTATPYRLGQGLLTDGGLFTDICYNKTNLQGFNELLDAGFLCKLIPRPTETELDVSNVGIDSTGDYKKNELQAAVDKKDVTSAALKGLIESRGCFLALVLNTPNTWLSIYESKE
jgi:DNA repair protein RadD